MFTIPFPRPIVPWASIPFLPFPLLSIVCSRLLSAPLELLVVSHVQGSGPYRVILSTGEKASFEVGSLENVPT